MTARSAPQTAIIVIMEEEHRLYQRLAAVAEAKREALIANDAETLTPLVYEMDGITRTIERLEDERRAHVALLCDEGDTVPFSTVTRLFDETQRPRLEGLRDALLTAVERVRTINTGNAALVRQALNFTDQWTRLLGGALPTTYGATGAVAGPRVAARAWSA